MNQRIEKTARAISEHALLNLPWATHKEIDDRGYVWDALAKAALDSLGDEFVIVPKEPTENMIKSTFREGSGHLCGINGVPKIYKAMIAAYTSNEGGDTWGKIIKGEELKAMKDAMCARGEHNFIPFEISYYIEHMWELEKNTHGCENCDALHNPWEKFLPAELTTPDQEEMKCE